jgi:hypothetical protein
MFFGTMCAADLGCPMSNVGSTPFPGTMRAREPERIWAGSRMDTASSKGYFTRSALVPCAMEPAANVHRVPQWDRSVTGPSSRKFNVCGIALTRFVAAVIACRHCGLQ